MAKVFFLRRRRQKFWMRLGSSSGNVNAKKCLKLLLATIGESTKSDGTACDRVASCCPNRKLFFYWIMKLKLAK
jgi:hypothetical protein